MLTTNDYTSSLLFGVQWDLVLKHIEVKEVAKGTALATTQNALRSNSTSWGNYRDAGFIINRGKYADCKTWKQSTTWTPYNQTTSNNFVKNGVKQVQSNTNGILLTTGASDVCKKMNIYDLAGNVEEWTLEYTNNSANSCARRSGNYQTSGSNIPASSRNLNPATTSVGTVGFRTALFK